MEIKYNVGIGKIYVVVFVLYVLERAKAIATTLTNARCNNSTFCDVTNYFELIDSSLNK